MAHLPSTQPRRRTKLSSIGIEVVAMSAVTDQLTKLGVTYEVISHEEAYTSIDEARSLGISADEVLKTIVLDTTAGHALAVILGSRRLDIRAVERAVGARNVRLATEEEMEKDFPSYELGAMPPLGSLHGTPTYVDPEVMRHDTVVFAAGTQTESLKVRTEDLFRDEPVTVTPLTRLAEAEERLVE
jgi:Ala-tRNA(Pro) deacylase